tara:strand:- start:218 stop:421 length:204 start_codon:yes stop_codon:yes gene_type:complete
MHNYRSFNHIGSFKNYIWNELYSIYENFIKRLIMAYQKKEVDPKLLKKAYAVAKPKIKKNKNAKKSY